MHDERIQKILSRANGLIDKGGGQYSCLGSCHDDRKNSVGIRVRENGIVDINCLAGCSKEQVLSSLGITKADLYPPKARSQRESPGTFVCAYDYHAADRSLLFQVCRFRDPKGFKQRRRDPSKADGWLWNLQGVDRVLYRLPSILAAGPDDLIFVVEGEKDADNLVKAGLIATTVPGGAGKWNETYGEALRGRPVVLIPDMDRVNPQTGNRPGWDHVVRVANELVDVAATVRILELPNDESTFPAEKGGPLVPKWDVTDWLIHGGTRAQFMAAVSSAPLWQRTEAAKPGASAAGNDRKPSAAEGITNYVELPPDDPDKPPVKAALSMPAILKHLFAKTDGWPKRVGGCLFIRDNSKPEVPNIAWLEKPQSLFGWLGSVTNIVPRITGGTGFHSSSEIYSEVARTAENFAAVEIIPHHPPIEGHFYRCKTPQPGDGSTLSTFLDRFNPASPIDRDLILAFLGTLLWGGPGGCRPVFVISSPDGRGAGKTRLVSMAAHLVGGQIELSPMEDIAALKTRLLSPDALRKRLATIDNVKSFKFSWGDLEALVTSPTITGKRMYVGEAERPGTITYCLTLNGPALSKDMAQRSVVIELSRPIYSGTWEEETRAFIDTNRQQLIGDLIGFLQGPQQMPRRFSRWGQWERDVLSRLPDPHEAQVVILDRQETTDADAEESAIIEDHFRIRLEQLGYIPGKHAVMVPSRFACRWFQEATGEKGSTQGISRRLIQAIDEGTLQRLRRNACMAWGRGFVWEGSDHQHDPSDLDSHIKIDLAERIAEMLARQA